MSGTVSAASAVVGKTFKRHNYPNPFFDLSQVYMPKGIKPILKFCRHYFHKNEFINSVLHKMTQYPITPLIYEDQTDPALTDKWDAVFYHNLNMKTFLNEVGLDYHVLGNCFVSANQKFKRQLKCKKCEEVVSAASVKDLKFQNNAYIGTCPNCGARNNDYQISDLLLKNINAINFVRWAPENIDIVYDPLTGDKEYYYTIPVGTRKSIKAGKLDAVNKIPKIFIDSIKQNRKIKLDPDNLYHLKRPGLSEEDMGWGKPTILPAMSLVWYMQTLRRGNEAIAMEHVVPMRAIFPASAGGDNPFLNMNLAGWKTRVKDELDNYRTDPNHIGIFPTPLGYQSLGGDAKSLMTTPELKFLEESIINSMGVPIEFIKGGTTWTGSSISLRIVENGFLSYREMLEDFINYFMIRKIVGMLGFPSVKVKFKKLRMTDDTESKNLALQLNSSDKLADSLLLQDLGYDVEENTKSMKEDLKKAGELEQLRARNVASAQNIIQIEGMRGQAQGEMAYLEEKSIINEELFSEEIANEAAQYMDGLDSVAFMKKLTSQLTPMPPKNQILLINSLQKTMPTVASLLMQRLQLSHEALLQSMPQTVESHQKQQELASKEAISQRRAANPKSNTEKHTASKRGAPK